MSLKKSKVFMTEGVEISIKGHRPVPGDTMRFEVAQDGLLRKFLEWMVAHPEVEIHLSTSGLGSCHGFAPTASVEALRAFFEEQGVKVK